MRFLLPLFLTFLGIVFVLKSPYVLAQESKIEPLKIIKKETCWTYSIIDNSPMKKGSLATQIEFNASGQKTKMMSFQPNGALAYEYFFEYKKNSRECYWKMEDGTLIKSEVETYNKAGKVQSRTRYSTNGKLLDKQVFEYENNLKTQETYFNSDGQKIYTIEYSYNKEQQTSREIYTNYITKEQTIGAVELGNHNLPNTYKEYKSSGPVVRSIEYKRDEKGRILEKNTYSSTNVLETKEVYNYTANKKECSVFIDGGKTLVEYVVYEYDYYL